MVWFLNLSGRRKKKWSSHHRDSSWGDKVENDKRNCCHITDNLPSRTFWGLKNKCFSRIWKDLSSRCSLVKSLPLNSLWSKAVTESVAPAQILHKINARNISVQLSGFYTGFLLVYTDMLLLSEPHKPLASPRTGLLSVASIDIKHGEVVYRFWG